MQPASLLGRQRFDLAAIYGVVEHDVLNQRVLDPACGSGTFLFHGRDLFTEGHLVVTTGRGDRVDLNHG